MCSDVLAQKGVRSSTPEHYAAAEEIDAEHDLSMGLVCRRHAARYLVHGVELPVLDIGLTWPAYVPVPRHLFTPRQSLGAVVTIMAAYAIEGPCGWAAYEAAGDDHADALELLKKAGETEQAAWAMTLQLLQDITPWVYALAKELRGWGGSVRGANLRRILRDLTTP